jgi:hypothetical protein
MAASIIVTITNLRFIATAHLDVRVPDIRKTRSTISIRKYREFITARKVASIFLS